MVKSTFWNMIPFKILTLALTGVSALLIHVIQKELTESIRKHIVVFFTRSQKEEHEWRKKKMKIFTEWEKKEKKTFTQWIIEKKASYIAWEEKEKAIYIEMQNNNKEMEAEISEMHMVLIKYPLRKFRDDIVNELNNEQRGTLDELKMKQVKIIEDLKLLKTKMIP